MQNLMACALEDARDHGRSLIQIIMDYQSYFDKISRGNAYACMKLIGVPDRAVMLLEDIYTDMTTRVYTTAGLTEPFSKNGKSGVGHGASDAPLSRSSIKRYS